MLTPKAAEWQSSLRPGTIQGWTTDKMWKESMLGLHLIAIHTCENAAERPVRLEK